MPIRKSLQDSLFETPEAALRAEEVADDYNVEDEAEVDADSHKISKRFEITSFGADLSVFDLTRRLGNEILIPAPFQRKFVWTIKHASRFIESILLGLPVPGIFIFERDRKQLIVDGQQRLITLKKYLSGEWNRKTRQVGKRETEIVEPFRLAEVAEPWNGCAFSDLALEDRYVIENYLLHATIFRQDEPKGRERSIYEVFERINTGGLRLSSQEIRACVSNGPFSDALASFAEEEEWRSVYGKRSPRLKDEELILRYFALLERRSEYERPMKVFLDSYLEDKQDLSELEISEMRTKLLVPLETLRNAIGPKLFRPENALNTAVFDAVMIGMSERLESGPIENPDELRRWYEKLLGDADFQKSYKRATADSESVSTRIKKAIEFFKEVP